MGIVMAYTPPEVELILSEVLVHLMRLYQDDEVGTVTIHFGNDDLRVDSTPKRQGKSVRIERKRLNVIRKAE